MVFPSLHIKQYTDNALLIVINMDEWGCAHIKQIKMINLKLWFGAFKLKRKAHLFKY